MAAPGHEFGKSLIRTEIISYLRPNSVLQGNYYRADNNILPNYSYYQIAINSSYQDNISEKPGLRAELNYDYSLDEGKPYIVRISEIQVKVYSLLWEYLIYSQRNILPGTWILMAVMS